MFRQRVECLGIHEFIHNFKLSLVYGRTPSIPFGLSLTLLNSSMSFQRSKLQQSEQLFPLHVTNVDSGRDSKGLVIQAFY
ncbi:hypothetical protein K435DRAFT_127411 [Dendrothele bispora CBS 962.96]|uniref:Uncharacterized protein n=1 Tax=Dendrothele bispora (strain CBS 962.96) TaxID=1314807 RepID=A0A4V4HAU5_DENBC|nr:hypothetical protein K435DRAFT_127411 [Dendrothele bispora CBS 962.96]